MSVAPSTSLAALLSVDLNELEKIVLDVIEAFGADGCISDEVRALLPTLSYSSVTARFSSLEEKGQISRKGDTRPGESGCQQKIMRHFTFSSSVTAPTKIKKRKPPAFLAGMMFAAKVVLKASDLNEAKTSLAFELRKAATR